MSEKFDYFVVGQGIAGTLLAFELRRRNKRVLVIDKVHPASSTRVAAGLYNPIVYKTLEKSWLADQLVPAAHQAYEQLEVLTQAKFDYRMPIVKVFGSQEEYDFWEKRSKEDDYSPYLSAPCKASFSSFLEMPYGYGEIRQSGYVDTKTLLEAYRNHLTNQACLFPEKFSHQDLIINDNFVEYKGFRASRIVFCEGLGIVNNPFFNYLPMKPTKGEVLTVKSEDIGNERIINKRVFLIPLGDNQYRIGSNYGWVLDEIPTEAAKKEITEALGKFWTAPYEILNHEAGIRPTVRDRRPLLGQHPQLKNLYVFNGLGTKGIMLAPWLSAHFCDYLELGTEIVTEASIERYKKFFAPKSD
jgi:glycine oxidase